MRVPNNAKDLMALACVAFKNEDFQGAGSLFTQAMSLHDSEKFVDSLLTDNFTLAALSSTIIEATDTDDPDQLASVASTLSFSMSAKFKKDLKESLDEERYDISESGCSAHKSQSEDESDDDLDDDDFEEDEEFDLSDDDLSDEDDLESDSTTLFKPVKSLISLK